MKKQQYDSFAASRAKQLRKEMTQQERHLWYVYLRNYPVKFYRQRPFDRYILDFYCSRAKLVIEIDGSQHFEKEGIQYDQARTEDLNRLGLMVLRFSNTDIDRHFRAVCEEIDRVVQARLPGKLQRD